MNKLTQAQWHQVAAASEIIMRDGRIIGVVDDGEEILFDSQPATVSLGLGGQ